MKKLIVFLIGLTFTSTGYAQAPAISWQKTLGGTGGDGASCLKQTSDGGYIVLCGSSSSDGDVTGNNGNGDYWIVKLDSMRNIVWEKSYGGSSADVPEYIEITQDGGYIAVGQSWSTDGDVTGNHGAGDYWVVKIDISGNLQWQKSLGGDDVEIAYEIHQTDDGGYIVYGWTYSDNSGDVGDVLTGGIDSWLVKISSSGGLLWQKCMFAGPYGYGISITSDGGFIATGSIGSPVLQNYHAGQDLYLIRLNSNGDTLWGRAYGGTSNEYGKCAVQTSDGGIIAAGIAQSNNGDVVGHHGSISGNDAWVIKTDNVGNLLWQKCFGSSGLDEAKSIQQTIDGGYIISGRTLGPNNGDVTGYNDGSDYWVIKLDSAGTLVWQKCLGGSEDEEANSIIQTTDGGFLVAGFSGSNDGDVLDAHGLNDAWIIKLGGTVGIKEIQANFSFSLSPNPAFSTVTILSEINLQNAKLEIFNLLGVRMYSSAYHDKLIVSCEHFAKGIYFVIVGDGNKQSVAKLIVQQ